MRPSEPPENLLKLPDESGVRPHLPTSRPPLQGREVRSRRTGGKQEVTRPPRITQRFQPTTCPRCHAVILHGIAAEGLTLHLDPTPLNLITEAASLLAGRMTWHMTADLEVCWRSPDKIRHWPAANTTHHAVFADHSCDSPIPATISSWAWGPHAPAPISEEPAF